MVRKPPPEDIFSRYISSPQYPISTRFIVSLYVAERISGACGDGACTKVKVTSETAGRTHEWQSKVLKKSAGHSFADLRQQIQRRRDFQVVAPVMSATHSHLYHPTIHTVLLRIFSYPPKSQGQAINTFHLGGSFTIAIDCRPAPTTPTIHIFISCREFSLVRA